MIKRAREEKGTGRRNRTTREGDGGEELKERTKGRYVEFDDEEQEDR